MAGPDLDRLLRPRSIAVIGASPTTGSLGASVLANLDRAGFAGALHLVNPRRREILGRACLASAEDLPLGVDCAILAIPREGVEQALLGCAARQVGSVIVFAAGFAEDGPEGRAAQARLARIAQDHGMALEGPNCLGTFNYAEALPLSFIDMPMEPLAGRKGLAIVSQSGAMAAVISVNLQQRALGLSYSISTGNEAALGVEDFVAYLLDDPATAVIVLVVEQFRQPGVFLDLARQARARGKPILLLHPGRCEAARASAATHTGAMTGDYELMRTQVTRAGVTMLNSLEETLDLAELVMRCPAPGASGAAIVAESGAFKALTLDFCAEIGLDLPALSEATDRSLRAVLPAFIPPANPLDITAQGLVDPTLYQKSLTPFLQDPAIGAVMLCIIMTNRATSLLKLGPIVQTLTALTPRKPVLFACLDECEQVPAEQISALRALGVPYFRSTERAYRALAHFLGKGAAVPPSFQPAVMPFDPPVPRGALSEYDSKCILARAGIAIPPGGLARTPAQARAIAARIGTPIVLKAQAAALAHKTEAGGVMLNVDAGGLDAAFAELCRRVGQARPDITLDGVLVETMAAPGVELIVGARRDPQWGVVILIGFGGVLAEALRDTRLIAADLPEAAIVAELHALKSAALLRGFRGKPAADLAAVARLIMNLAALLRAAPTITEIDLNPVMVDSQGATALDGLIVSA